MGHNFNNTILIIIFNFSTCINNISILDNLYGKHFKKIIYYSDIPANKPKENEYYENNVNYISIEKGYFAYRVFPHFYKKYSDLFNDSDGVFYTMDDNIINVKLLNNFSNDKILYYKNKPTPGNIWFNCELQPINICRGWWFEYCDGHWGYRACRSLLNDDEYKKYNFHKFTGKFSDWFYIPKKYFNNELMNLFNLYSKHGVFLEIAIPSIIQNFISDYSEYQDFKEDVKWGGREILAQKEYLQKTFNEYGNFIVHPIKFNQYPSTTEYLLEIFNS
jgi:hypothetical protein